MFLFTGQLIYTFVETQGQQDDFAQIAPTPRFSGWSCEIFPVPPFTPVSVINCLEESCQPRPNPVRHLGKAGGRVENVSAPDT